MRALRSAILSATAALSLLTASTRSAAAPDATLAPSAAATCMTPAAAERVRPDYPAEALRLNESARVEAVFVFEAPDRAPKVEFVDLHHPGMFEAPIEAYARQLRVPCLAAGGAPVRLQQEFFFQPNDGRKVVYSAVVDQADAQRRKTLQCGTWPRGEDGAIAYPATDLRMRRQGIVVVKAHFVDGAKAPEIVVLDDGGSARFVDAVRPYLAQMRVPCLGDSPVDLHMFFKFEIPGVAGTRHVLNDMGLPDFLRMAETLPKGVYFDTTSMACPFDVRLRFREPYEPNGLSELDQDVPARHAFLDWLASLKLKVDPATAKELFDQQAVIHVPCLRLDL